MRPKYLAWGVLALVAIAALATGVVIVRRGFSARDQPSWPETVVARTVRRMAVPEGRHELKNPVPLTEEVLADARAHFADHCASCHANDGSGNTNIGKNLYPKAPDMRLEATQQLTDGELYSIIQDGIRLTGMPAWGKEADDTDADSWKLVHLIRHLKELTPEQLDEMEKMNPKSPEELEEERREEEFLRGGAEPAEGSDTPQPPRHKH